MMSESANLNISAQAKVQLSFKLFDTMHRKNASSFERRVNAGTVIVYDKVIYEDVIEVITFDVKQGT